MQPVEKKRKKSRKKRWTALLAGFLLLCAAAGGYEWLQRTRTASPEEDAAEAQRTEAGTLLERRPEEIETIHITLRDGTGWQAVRREDGTYHLAETDQSIRDAGDRILEALANLDYVWVYEPESGSGPLDWADFGLASPRLRAEWQFQNGEQWQILIGAAVEGSDGSEYYMRVEGQPFLYGVSAGTLQDLEIEEGLLYDIAQPVIHPARLTRMTVMNGTGEKQAEWTLQGEITDQDAPVSWLVTAPFEYIADEEIISNLKSAAGSFRLGMYVCGASDEAMGIYGINSPRYRIQLKMAAGTTGTVTDQGVYDVQDWEAQTVEIIVGKEQDDLTDYVYYDGDIYTVSHLLISPLVDTDPLDTVARYPVLVPLNSLETLTVVRDGETTVYRIERTGTDTEEDDAEYSCYKNEAAISYEAFSAAYDRMLVVTFSGKLPEGAAWDEPHETYIFHTVTGKEHVVALSAFDPLHDAVTVDGYTLFYLIRGGMTGIP